MSDVQTGYKKTNKQNMVDMRIKQNVYQQEKKFRNRLKYTYIRSLQTTLENKVKRWSFQKIVLVRAICIRKILNIKYWPSNHTISNSIPDKG